MTHPISTRNQRQPETLAGRREERAQLVRLVVAKTAEAIQNAPGYRRAIFTDSERQFLSDCARRNTETGEFECRRAPSADTLAMLDELQERAAIYNALSDQFRVIEKPAVVMDPLDASEAEQPDDAALDALQIRLPRDPSPAMLQRTGEAAHRCIIRLRHLADSCYAALHRAGHTARTA